MHAFTQAGKVTPFTLDKHVQYLIATNRVNVFYMQTLFPR